MLTTSACFECVQDKVTLGAAVATAVIGILKGISVTHIE